MPDFLLFDLDGTLADTAPTLIGIVNALLAEDKLPALPQARARNLVSRGAVPLLELGFGAPQSLDNALHRRFIDRYERVDHSESRYFINLPTLVNLDCVSEHYAIVTNKPTTLTAALLAKQPPAHAPAAVVCGDTLPVKKPDPAPLLHAAASLGAQPSDCVYVGDDERDVVAGRAAGMRTVIAAWGYIPPATPIDSWGATAIAAHPDKLPEALALARAAAA